ncbi:MAG: SDR family NAD(P)-dependent oxidoreductase [Pseudomonadales bacterium]
MNSWTDKIAVITGAGSGIGAGLARQCLSKGMFVVACDISKEGLEALQPSAAKSAGTLTTHVLDVSSADSVEKLAEHVFTGYGRVNLLFNNAGVLVDGKCWERELRDWRWIVDVNIMGVIHGVRSFVPKMLAQGEAGRVINTSSIGGLLGGGAYMAPYQSSKHFVTAFTETLFQELQLEDAPISASVLCPAEVATGIWESDRLRDAQQHNVLGSEAEQQSHDMIAGSVADGLTPDDFAELVFSGIEEGKFWLLPQPEFKAMFQKRHDSIIKETQPLSIAELMGL